MKMHLSAVTRWVAIGLIVASLGALAVAPASAQRLPPGPARAEQIRALVLAQRERVLERVAALLAGEPDAQQRDVTAEERAAPEASEPDGGEAAEEDTGGEDVAEIEDGEADTGEGGAAEEEDVRELPETGTGHRSGTNAAFPALAALLSILGALGIGRRRFIQHRF